MIQPETILQIDSRWNKVRYALNDNDKVNGEIANIGNSGCGPACMAMVIVTLTGNTSVTAVTLCEWALQRGYKLLNQGTSYDYLIPQGRAYGISLTKMNSINNYHNGNNQNIKTVRNKVLTELENGNWVIACMGPSIWTSWGHYVLAYYHEDDKVYINDPANITKIECMVADTENFLDNAKYFWLVDVNKYLKAHKDRKEILIPTSTNNNNTDTNPTPSTTNTTVNGNNTINNNITSTNSSEEVTTKSVNIFNNNYNAETIFKNNKLFINPEILRNIGLEVINENNNLIIRPKTVKVNNKVYTGFYDNGRAFITLEDYEKSIGSDVGWDSKSETVLVIRN